MGGSARPKRRRATKGALGHEHVRRRPSTGQQAREKTSWKNVGGGCLILLAALAASAAFGMTAEAWGQELWGRAAPASPGGGYGFAAAVGAVLPFGLAALIAPLSRMKWKERPLRSLGWAVASLPGLAACCFCALVVFTTSRPKYHRDWNPGCYSRGNPCWVHVEYPWVWALGLLSTVLATAVLFTVLFRIDKARRSMAAG
ncbi:hypothetical protein ACFVU0_27735 [Streptomyces sp. NPDC058122]|uniref:hypothetical protein n=1 Tax=Streptomyces sp. NPDC058122 TaxID=3346349 RepID=UPI0036F05854